MEHVGGGGGFAYLFVIWSFAVIRSVITTPVTVSVKLSITACRHALSVCALVCVTLNTRFNVHLYV